MTGDRAAAPGDDPTPEDHFGAEVAARYDHDERRMFTPAAVGPAVDFLVDLAAGRPALELAVGTGRIALPLAARGLEVTGVDLSESMLAELRAKPGSETVTVTQGDIAGARLGRTFGLVYLVFNTIGNLTSQAMQVECFRTAAAHLDPGGHFVVEVGVPQLRAVPAGGRYRTYDVSDDHIGIESYDIATQLLVSHHVTRVGSGWRRESLPLRYVWPPELDLMAQLAGLVPCQRWADWSRAPFTSDSPAHVSVWRRPPAR